MSTTGASGRTYHLGYRRGRERPEKWRFELVPPRTVDRTKVRSLRQFYMQPPFDQGDEGSCTANSGCLVAQACEVIDGKPAKVFSRMWMYAQERGPSLLNTFPQDSGADVIDEEDVDLQFGNILDSVWTYDANPSEQAPAAAATVQKFNSVAAYQPIAAGTQATIDAILTALDNNQPVAIGLAWSNAFTTAYENGAVVTPSMYQNMNEGHALSVVGWAPPSTAHPNGVFTLQGSWGAVSPAETSIWADAKAGDHYFDASLFTATSGGQPIVSDIFAAVPMASPATLSSVINGPTSGQVGAALAFSDVVTGAPVGTVLSYAWTVNGQTISGMTAATLSWTPSAAGAFTLACTATNSNTGAATTATMSVSVSASPTPTPTPTPAPPSPTPAPVGPTESQIDADMVSTEGQLKALASTDPKDALTYNYAAEVMAWEQSRIDNMFQGKTPAAGGNTDIVPRLRRGH